MKLRFQYLYMDIASRVSEMSRAQRLKVGAIIVKNDTVISMGFNGTPRGWDNNCEYKEYCLDRDFTGEYFPGTEEEYPFEDTLGRYRLKTKPEVLHAEMNSLMKLAKSTESGDHASMFITHSPCMDCAKGIYQSGIKEVFYRDAYRSEDGINFLKKCGVSVSQLTKETHD